MGEREVYLLLEKAGKRWKLVRRFTDLDLACAARTSRELMYPMKRFAVAIEEAPVPPPPSPQGPQ